MAKARGFPADNSVSTALMGLRSMPSIRSEPFVHFVGTTMKIPGLIFTAKRS